MAHLVLALDVAGTPVRWVDIDKAISLHVADRVAWELGETIVTYRGGTNHLTGLVSTVSTASIIAVRGREFRGDRSASISVSRERLFARDKYICGYCGGHFAEHDLTIEHVTPESRGGANTWENIVTACRSCNQRKANRTPEQAGMPLLYLPYRPNRWEGMILRNRRILADQMEFLMAGVPVTSRLLLAA
ncbi:HNH endonuclease [Pigmentiphaga soli]|uniref:HNH endonuclease n=1 Tax=Pigmentiphaga soli TaxID=1007095 RepID=UPI003CD09B7A